MVSVSLSLCLVCWVLLSRFYSEPRCLFVMVV